ncbi:MAG: anti-sigma factor family protein [Acidobacteriota bacterium]
MVDRQDIDALLVGALYGELTPAEEARLAAHLESHPADRSALADLQTARQAVRESRVLEVQHDPPQAISALLLQEAHRRAPRVARQEQVEREGWFARLARSFMAHPAMAAAAMLVVVVGVAGTLYMKKGDQFAGKEVAAPAATDRAEPTASTPPSEPEAANGVAAGSGYSVGLAEGETAPADHDTRARQDQAAPAGTPQAPAEQEKKLEVAKDKSAELSLRQEAKPSAHSAPQRPIAITTAKKEPMPRELEAPKRKSADRGGFASLDDNLSGRIGAGGAGSAPATGGVRAPAAPAPAPQMQPPPPPAPTVATTSEAPRSKADTAGPAPAQAKNAQDASLMAWAQSELNKTIALAHKDCVEAAKHAMNIRARAPEFYQQNVAQNRQLKSCSGYIRAAAEQTDERNQQKRARPAETERVK